MPGTTIARLRLRLCWTQDELGARIGRAGATVSRWESGARTPSLEDLQLVAEALGVTASLLVGAIAEP